MESWVCLSSSGLALGQLTLAMRVVWGQGHVVYLKDPEMFWEKVGGSLSLPLLPLTTFDVDIGDWARIESIRIVNGQVSQRNLFLPVGIDWYGIDSAIGSARGTLDEKKMTHTAVVMLCYVVLLGWNG